MTSYKRFEDIPVFIDSIALIEKIYEISNSGNFNKDYGLKDQIRRAAVSIASNIAEGFERQSKSEFIRFLFYSKGSIGEVRTQLLISMKLKYINEEIYKNINKNCLSISKQIASFIKYLSDNK